MNQFSFNSPTGQIVAIPRSDRAAAYQRLQELSIACWCSEDGHLRVDVDNVVVALQLRSVVQQITASRRVLMDWLERCWHVEE